MTLQLETLTWYAARNGSAVLLVSLTRSKHPYPWTGITVDEGGSLTEKSYTFEGRYSSVESPWDIVDYWQKEFPTVSIHSRGRCAQGRMGKRRGSKSPDSNPTLS